MTWLSRSESLLVDTTKCRGLIGPILTFKSIVTWALPGCWSFKITLPLLHREREELNPALADAIIQQRKLPSSDRPLAAINQQRGWLAFFQTQSTDTRDSFGLITFNVVSARVEKVKEHTPEGWRKAGWLPSRAVAQEWLSSVQQQQHPILPLH